MAQLRKRKASSEAGFPPTSSFARSAELIRRQGLRLVLLQKYPAAASPGQPPVGAEGLGLTQDGYLVHLKAQDPAAAAVLLDEQQFPVRRRVAVRNARVTTFTTTNPNQARLADFQLYLAADSEVCSEPVATLL